MDRNHSSNNHKYHQQQQQHHYAQNNQGNVNPYSWQNGGRVPPPAAYGGVPPSASQSHSHHPQATSNPNLYYNQAQGNQSAHSHTYTNEGAAASVPPNFQNQPGYAQYGGGGRANASNMNPWGSAYNQTYPYNTAGVSNSGVQQSGPTSQQQQLPNNLYMQPPPPSSSATVSPSISNQNQRPSISYPYYQQQQHHQQHYYPPPPPIPNGVPPPPLPPQKSANPPPLPPVPAERAKEDRTASSSKGITSSTCESNSQDNFKPSASASADGDMKSGKDKKPPEEEKETKKAVPIMVGKRRGGRVLPTGVVKKQKTDEENAKGKTDAWSQYMAEVRRYKDQSCTEERQNRPLVK